MTVRVCCANDPGVCDHTSAPKYKKAKEIWNPIDLRAYGRCYTAKPTPEMMKFGIKKVAIILWQRSLIFFHNPGMLTTAKQRNGIDIMLKEKFYIDLEYELFRMRGNQEMMILRYVAFGIVSYYWYSYLKFHK